MTIHHKINKVKITPCWLAGMHACKHLQDDVPCTRLLNYTLLYTIIAEKKTTLTNEQSNETVSLHNKIFAPQFKIKRHQLQQHVYTVTWLVLRYWLHICIAAQQSTVIGGLSSDSGQPANHWALLSRSSAQQGSMIGPLSCEISTCRCLHVGIACSNENTMENGVDWPHFIRFCEADSSHQSSGLHLCNLVLDQTSSVYECITEQSTL